MRKYKKDLLVKEEMLFLEPFSLVVYSCRTKGVSPIIGLQFGAIFSIDSILRLTFD